ncbi:MAG: hypothetical protein JXP34_04720 [Planctomycetes bacterium]|nr:hypothetical protein [Planctomycetota bacterium]
MDEARERSFYDPRIAWEGAFPYEALRGFGIRPESSCAEVLDASFRIPPDALRDPEVNVSWETLRTPRKRLLVDLFCFELPPEAPAACGSEDGPAPAALPWRYLRGLAGACPPHRGKECAGDPPDLPLALEGALPRWDADEGGMAPEEERKP